MSMSSPATPTTPATLTDSTTAPPRRTALLLGASGLVGGQLLDLLLEAPDFTDILAPTRSPLARQHGKLHTRLLDPEAPERCLLPAIDDVFCCLGTTLKAAGSKAAFRHIDHDLVLALARQAQAAGARQFLLVSSIGADSRSPFFYMRTKGETEDALKTLAYPSTSVFHPAYLTGQRRQSRLLEDLTGQLMQRLAWLMPPAYRPVAARQVAHAMLTQARRAPPGFHTLQPILFDLQPSSP